MKADAICHGFARVSRRILPAFAAVGYDRRGRLVAVRENGADVERYAYDAAGNMVRRTVRGRTTAFAFDAANQLVSSTAAARSGEVWTIECGEMSKQPTVIDISVRVDAESCHYLQIKISVLGCHDAFRIFIKP